VVMVLCSGASVPLNRPVQRWAELAFDTGCVIRTAQVTGPFDPSPLSVPSREVYERSTAGTSQVSGRSAKVAPHRPDGSWFIRGRSLRSAAHVQARRARAAARRGQSKAIPDISRGSRECPWIPWATRGPDPRSASIFWEPDGLFTEDGGHRNPGASGSVNRPLPLPRPERSAQNAPPGRVHDRGRCPLYVRAQLETAGLPWTQRDNTSPKATAREAGNPQLTGRFRRWWQVLGSNQRRLSRRFYRPIALMQLDGL
jgi:hypothetical protein